MLTFFLNTLVAIFQRFEEKIRLRKLKPTINHKSFNFFAKSLLNNLKVSDMIGVLFRLRAKLCSFTSQFKKT